VQIALFFLLWLSLLSYLAALCPIFQNWCFNFCYDLRLAFNYLWEVSNLFCIIVNVFELKFITDIQAIFNHSYQRKLVGLKIYICIEWIHSYAHYNKMIYRNNINQMYIHIHRHWHFAINKFWLQCYFFDRDCKKSNEHDTIDFSCKM
jgi:hypothetical protein